MTADETKFIATVKVEKVTPTTRTVGFTTESRDTTTVEVASVKVSDSTLEGLKDKVAEHLSIVKE